jgi:hypothetical protein
VNYTYIVFFTLLVAVLNISSNHPLLTRVRSGRFCVVAFILNTAIAFFGLGLSIRFINDQTLLKYVHYLLGFSYIAYIYVVFEESIWKKLFVMYSIWLFSTISLLVGTLAAGLVIDFAGSGSVHVLGYVFRSCIQLALLFAIWRWISAPFKKVLEVVSDKTVAAMSLYPIIGFILFTNNYLTSYGRLAYSGSAYHMLFFLSFVVLGYVLVFAGISSASKIMSLQYEVDRKARDISERKLVAMEQERTIADLQKAIAQVKQLSGLLPICASCKKIRNDEGYWEQLETYLKHHSGTEFSHAICPDCASRLYPDHYKGSKEG